MVPAKKKKFTCKRCGKQVASNKILKDHLIRIHHEESNDGKRYICSFCKKVCSTDGALLSHKQKHGPPDKKCLFFISEVGDGDEAGKCWKECSFVTKQAQSLSAHERGHYKKRDAGNIHIAMMIDGVLMELADGKKKK